MGLLGKAASGKLALSAALSDPSQRMGLSQSLGSKRSLLGVKSVRNMALSSEGKGEVINAIADNALASFVLIQVWGL